MKTLSYDSLTVGYKVEIIKDNPVSFLSFSGKITHQNASNVIDDLDSILDNDIPSILLEMTKLEFMNSLGLALVLSMVRKTEDRGGKFAIGGYHPLLEMVIQLVEASDKVNIYSSVEEAFSRW
jgi:anti-anti-sigma factor